MGTIAARFVGHTAIPDRTSVFEHWQHSPVPQKARHSFLSSVVFPCGEIFPVRTVLRSPSGLSCTCILRKSERLFTEKLTFVNRAIHRSPSPGIAAASAPCSKSDSRRIVPAGRRGVRERRLLGYHASRPCSGEQERPLPSSPRVAARGAIGPFSFSGKDCISCPDTAFGPTSCQRQRHWRTDQPVWKTRPETRGGSKRSAILRCKAARLIRKAGPLTNPHRRRPSGRALQGSECLVAFLGRFYLPVNWPAPLLRAGLLF